MPAQAHLLRQLLLVQKLRASPGRCLPFAELQRHLLEHSSLRDYGGSYTQRILQRDLPAIADTFGVRISCRRGAGYYIAGADPLLAGQQQLLDALEVQEFLRLPAALAPFVQPEPRRPRGLEHLRPLLQAAQAGRLVELDYQKHEHASLRRRTCGPLLLREFRGRWYVLAGMARSQRLACFVLDRITHLHPTDRPATPPPGFDAATHFAHCFGVTRPAHATDAPPPDILLRLRPTQARYALSYPLHPAQRLLRQSTTETVLALPVYDTHELRMELLSYGPDVQVLAPQALGEWLREQHGQAARAAWQIVK